VYYTRHLWVFLALNHFTVNGSHAAAATDDADDDDNSKKQEILL